MSKPTPSVVIERTFRASIEEVWDLWMTKEGFESWWGPEGFRADVHKLEPRQGGALEYDMVADTPEMVAAMRQMNAPPSHPVHARFSMLEPRDKLVLTNVIDFLPGVPAYESKISVDFYVAGENVRMVVTLDPMHDEEFSRQQQEGFTSQLRKLERRFS